MQKRLVVSCLELVGADEEPVRIFLYLVRDVAGRESAQRGLAQFKVIDDPSIDTTSRTGKLVMGILALIAEFENDIRRERQMDGIRRPVSGA